MVSKSSYRRVFEHSEMVKLGHSLEVKDSWFKDKRWFIPTRVMGSVTS